MSAGAHTYFGHFAPPPRRRQCLPYLKSCMRGMGWQDSHWAQLFSLLGFKPGMLTKENVTLSHFLDKSGAVVANAEVIKALDATVRRMEPAGLLAIALVYPRRLGSFEQL